MFTFNLNISEFSCWIPNGNYVVTSCDMLQISRFRIQIIRGPQINKLKIGKSEAAPTKNRQNWYLVVDKLLDSNFQRFLGEEWQSHRAFKEDHENVHGGICCRWNLEMKLLCNARHCIEWHVNISCGVSSLRIRN